MDYELKQSYLPTAGLYQQYPQSTMVYFQFVFCAITLILIAGSYLCRMNFFAWMAFVPLWVTFSYAIGAFSVWGGGFLFKLGVIDYSGGYVIHLSSGTAGFVGAYWIGPRIEEDLDDATPNNILLMLVGAGILWIGWNGFNGGDPYSASPDAGAAVLNTNLCTAFSSLVWVIMDLIYFRRPSVIGAIQGMITGLVAITPAAGVVAGWGAFCLGLASGIVPWVSLRDSCYSPGHSNTHPALAQSWQALPQDLPNRRRYSRRLPHSLRRFPRRWHWHRHLRDSERLRSFRPYQPWWCHRRQRPPSLDSDCFRALYHWLERRLDLLDHALH